MISLGSRRRRRLVDFVALLSVAAVLAGCSAREAPSASSLEGSSAKPTTTPAPSPSPAPSPVGSPTTDYAAEADGLTLTVTLDRAAVAPSEGVTFTVTLQNGTTEPVDYSVPWCGGGASVALSVDLPQEPVGKTWSGIAQTFKDYVLTEGLGPTRPPRGRSDRRGRRAMRERRRVRGDPRARRFGHEYAALEGWRSWPVSAHWLAPSHSLCRAGYDRQNDPPSHVPGTGVQHVGPDVQATRRQWRLRGRRGRSGTRQPGRDHRRPAHEQEVRELARRRASGDVEQRESLPCARQDRRLPSKVRTWNLDLFVEVDVPRHFAIAFIDPFDASILLVQYCDVPCVE